MSNAGFGWRLSLGEFWDGSILGAGNCTNCYIGPDGSHHPFYPTVHPGPPDDGPTMYTWDGTYLRLRTLSGGVHEIDFPNGEIHQFDSAGRLVKIRDPFGNAVNVSYGLNNWTITDSRGRTHTMLLPSYSSSSPQRNSSGWEGRCTGSLEAAMAIPGSSG